MSQVKLIIFSAPSGAGKTTLVRHALSTFSELAFSISCTTREKRVQEVDGKDYYFISQVLFQEKITNNEFVEWEEVYDNNFYGTLKSEIDRIILEGKSVVFDMDVEGALNIKKIYGSEALTVFVHPLSLKILEERLISRNTESESKLKQRLGKAEKEMALINQFDEVLWNEDLEQAKKDTEALLRKYLFDNSGASLKL